MKALKILVVVLFVIMGGLAVVGMFMPSEWQVERSTTVDAPPSSVYAVVSTAAGWERWTAFNKQADPSWAMTRASPVEAGPGTVMRWTSIKYGGHTVTLTAAEPDTRVAYTLLLEPQQFELQGEVRIEPAGAGSRVTWQEKADIGHSPFHRLVASLMKDAVGADFDLGIAQLKAAAESGQGD